MSTFLVVSFVSLRKTAVTTGSSYGNLPTHIALSRHKERQQRTPPLMSLPKLGRKKYKRKQKLHDKDFKVANTHMDWKQVLLERGSPSGEDYAGHGKQEQGATADLLSEMGKALTFLCASVSPSAKQGSSLCPAPRGAASTCCDQGYAGLQGPLLRQHRGQMLLETWSEASPQPTWLWKDRRTEIPIFDPL